MLKKTLIIVSFLSVFIFSCKGQEKVDFLNYPVDKFEGITTTWHSGVYRNFDFEYLNGWVLFYLIPKENPEQWLKSQLIKIKGSNDSDKENILINNLNNNSFRELSKEFNIYVFHIDKKYLEYTPQMDNRYCPKIPRINNLYKLNFDESKIEKLDSLIIKTDQDESKESDWMDDTLLRLMKYNQID